MLECFPKIQSYLSPFIKAFFLYLSFNPHFSPAIYCNAKSAHACCFMLLHPLLRFNVLLSTPPAFWVPRRGLQSPSWSICIHGHLWDFATIPGEKCGL